MYRHLALALSFALAAAAAQDIVADVRAQIARNDFAAGENLIQSAKQQHGVTPELIEAVSWLGRGALAAKQLDRADAYAVEARKLILTQLSRRKLDAEPRLPLALGASIEVQAFVMDARGERDQAVQFLRRELTAWRRSSVEARIQKNIHLLSLEGKPAPPLNVASWVGPKPSPLTQLRGKPVVLFFWAHWCVDCKKQARDLARVLSENKAHGLTLVAPTQLYGYTSSGEDATPQDETGYIDAIRRRFYSVLGDMPAPLSAENFRAYGSSSSPTLVLLDRKGIVRLYHPGAMSYAELAAGVRTIVAD